MVSASAHAPSPLERARDYLRRGWFPVPVPERAKGPTVAGWQHLRLTDEQLPRYFPRGTRPNIGVLLGAPSGGLVDVDLDAPAARVVGARLLPQTQAIFGRAASPRSHYLYVVTGSGVPRTRQLRRPGPPKEADDAMLVELRSTGGQTVFPGSVHPSGEHIRWDSEGEPTAISAQRLIRATEIVAAGALLVPHWRQGQRNQLQMAMAGALLRARWSEDQTTRFICAVGAAGGDGDERTRAKVRTIVHLTAAKVAEGAQATGLPTLAEVIGDDATVTCLATWLRVGLSLPPAPPSDSAPGAAPPRDRANGHHGGAEGVQPDEAPPSAVRGSWIKLSAVAAERVEWVWERRIPKAKLTLIGGDPGVGKSFLLLALLTHVTRGHAWPDGLPCPGPADCILLCGEDGLADTVRPRVDALGGDPERVWPFKGMILDDGTVRWPSLSSALDIAEIERKIGETGAQMVLVDPTNTYLDPKLDTFRGPPMRTITTPLAGLAERTGVAVVLVCHLTKATLQQALYRMPGSVDFVAAARSVLAVGYDPDPEREDGRRLLLPVKNNLSAHAPGLGFNIVDGKLMWDKEEVGASAATMLAGGSDPGPNGTGGAERRGPGRPSKVEGVADVLRLLLRPGPLRVQQILKAMADAGISESTVDRAKKDVGVDAFKMGKGDDQAWYWRLRATTPGGDNIDPPGFDALEKPAQPMGILVGEADTLDEIAKDDGIFSGTNERIQACQKQGGQYSGLCSDCGAPIVLAWGRCPDCRSRVYEEQGMTDDEEAGAL